MDSKTYKNYINFLQPFFSWPSLYPDPFPRSLSFKKSDFFVFKLWNFSLQFCNILFMLMPWEIFIEKDGFYLRSYDSTSNGKALIIFYLNIISTSKLYSHTINQQSILIHRWFIIDFIFNI